MTLDPRTRLALERERLGLAGRLASAFIDSKLTPLLVFFALALGALAVIVTPREEEPQIKVPMVDVFASLPGRSSVEVEREIASPLEKAFWSIPGVEYVYSTSSPGSAFVIVRFRVGEDPDRALVRVRAKLDALADAWPRDVPPPLVKPRSIDDVPIWALTFWSPTQDPATLRQVAAEVENEIKSIPEVSDTALIGGLRREFRVELDPSRLAARGLAAGPVLRAIAAGNRRVVAGEMVAADRGVVVEAGGFVESARDLGSVVVAERSGRTVRLSDVATVVDGPERPASYVTHGEPGRPGRFAAVTLAVSKRRGANAISVVHAIERKLAALEPRLLAADVHTTVTRDYGETAAEKSNELLEHMLLATLSVALLIALAMGCREAGVVRIAVPVTLALTLFVFMLFGYTLNRVTLFALIFSIGILVDDAIVVVENIDRHLRLPRRRGGRSPGSPWRRPTRSATRRSWPPSPSSRRSCRWRFVGGLMGPYMRPDPGGRLGGHALFAARGVRDLALGGAAGSFAASGLGTAGHGKGERSRLAAHLPEGDDTARFGRRPALPRGLLRRRRRASPRSGRARAARRRHGEDASLRQQERVPGGGRSCPTARPSRRRTDALSEMADALAPLPEVTGTEVYAGAAAPYNFNGLVRHYFLRPAPHQGDLQVNLVPEGGAPPRLAATTSRSACEAPRADRPAHGARVKVVEMPPGPPVLQTLVAEIYGPGDAGRREVARQVRGRVRDDRRASSTWTGTSRAPRDKVVYRLDREKAGPHGIRAADVAATLSLARSARGRRRRFTCRGSPRAGSAFASRCPRTARHDLAALGALSVADAEADSCRSPRSDASSAFPPTPRSTTRT